MRSNILAATIACAGAPAIAQSGNPTARHTPEQMAFLGQLGNAYATARHCNMLISYEATR